MPLHGERPGSPQNLFQRKDWFRAISLHRQAILDIRQCIDLAQTRKDLDLSRGVTLAGYSMGSWLNSIAGPADDRVRAMVLMVGGATDAGPVMKMLPALAAADPLQALPKFAGRPLLLMNGRHDTTVTPDMAERLLAAAPQPSEHRWYDSGHRLPEEAYHNAAKWVRKTWDSLAPSTD
jgi:pimeloyl-ACP methyl ester carboxylesterase